MKTIRTQNLIAAALAGVFTLATPLVVEEAE